MKRARRGRGVDVAGGVGRADLERVGAVGERGGGERATCRWRSAAASTRHSKVDAGLVGGERERRRVVVASGSVGPASIVVSGAVGVDRRTCGVAGVASVLPAASVARTSNVCVPSAERPAVNGEVQAANAGAVDAALERRAGLARGEGEGRRRVVGRAAPAPLSIVVSGAVGVDRERARGGRGVDVAGGVGGADVEGVRAVGRARRS